MAFSLDGKLVSPGGGSYHANGQAQLQTHQNRSSWGAPLLPVQETVSPLPSLDSFLLTLVLVEIFVLPEDILIPLNLLWAPPMLTLPICASTPQLSSSEEGSLT